MNCHSIISRQHLNKSEASGPRSKRTEQAIDEASSKNRSRKNPKASTQHYVEAGNSKFLALYATGNSKFKL
jgi:hypothetical protein